MVPRPGTTGSEDGHQIKQEPEARAPTTDGSSPDTQLAMRPASPQIHEGTSVAPDIKVEVKAPDIKVEGKKEEYEEKYPVPVMASQEAIKGSATQQSPPGSSVKSRSSKDDPMSHKTSKTTRKKGMPMKAPDEEEEEMKPPAPLPTLTASLAHHFGIQELGRLLQEDPVLMALDARASSRLHGPVSIPRIDEVYTTLEAVRMLLTLLEESGLEVRTRDLSALASFDVDVVTNTIRRLFHTLGEIVGIAMKREPSPRQAPSPRRRKATAGSSTGSSRYRSVSSIVDESDSGSNAPERMIISPEAPPFRPAEAAPAAALPSTQSTLPLPAMPSLNVPGMQPDMFQRALDALVRGVSGLSPPTAPVPGMTVSAPPMVVPQMSAAPAPTMTAPEIPATRGPGSDVSMRSAYPTSTQAAYPADDPDDFFDLGTQTGATSRSAVVASNGSGGSMTRIRISATSDLKSFSGRDATEEKSRTWLNKLQSAAKRDGMSSAEMCLLMNDLITGPARQWYLQLSRDIRSSWNDLSSQFQYQYCGKGVSVARKYYHATKRSDETPLEYLHRLTVAGIRAKLRVKDGNAAERREHVEHFIDTLGSHEQALADQLIMLSIEDAEALERILRARQRSRDRQGKAVYNPSKFRAKTPAPTPAKAVNSLRAHDEQGHNDYAMVSQVEEERREEPTRVSAMTPANRGDENSTEPHQRPPCSHCGLTLHKSEDCWTILTCSHCNGRHPSDRCLKLCKACGEMHEAGACRFEEFFNVMRQWYVPQRHAGMLPPDAEKLLN